MKTSRFEFHDSTLLSRRLNRVESGDLLIVGIVVFVSWAFSVLGDEPVWSMYEGKILRDGAVFVESGIEPPLGILPGQNGSVIVAQSTELTQIFDESGDGKGDFFRALVADLPTGDRIVSGPTAGPHGSVYFSIDRAGKYLDLVSWSADAPQLALILQLPDTAQCLTVSKDDIAVAVVADSEGAWIGAAQLPSRSNAKDAAGDEPKKSAQLAEVVIPKLAPAIRIPKPLFGENDPMIAMTGMKAGGDAGKFEMKVGSEGRRFLVDVVSINGRFQGGAVPLAKGDDEFSIAGIELETDGFAIQFNRPVDRGAIGGETIPFQILGQKLAKGEELKSVAIREAVIEPDGLTLTLIPEVLSIEHFYVFDLSALKSETGDALGDEKACYTVFQVPAATVVPPVIEAAPEQNESSPPETEETPDEEEEPE